MKKITLLLLFLFVTTVGQHGTENVIAKYVKEQGMEKEYKTLKKDYQLKLF